MDTFPTLTTGAVVQYPSGYSRAYRTHVLRYLDGRTQRLRETANEIRRWVVNYETLTPDEVRTLIGFFRQQKGRAGTFQFIDPWTSELHVCCCDRDVLDILSAGESRARLELVLREVAP